MADDPRPSEDAPSGSAELGPDSGERTAPGPPEPSGPELDLGARARLANIRASLFGTLPEPVRVDRFIILDTLGAGGMGMVHAAYDPRLDRRVALKLVKPEFAAATAGVEGRLLREARAMARLSHPNVVQIHEVGVWRDRVFIAMELVVGRSLDAWLAQHERPWRDIVRVFAEAGRGLAVAHAANLVHRDFKPANVLVGDDGRVRVTDFGLARGPLAETDDALASHASGDPVGALAGSPSNAPSARAGTPGYMSPEQFRGEEATAASDQFSFCVALWQALHGTPPFAGHHREARARAVLDGAIQEPPRLRIPRRIHRALVRGLARQPEARFPSMSALLAAIEVRPRWRTAALAALFFAAGLGASFLVLGREDPCTDHDPLFAGAWDPDTRAAAEQAFTASGLAEAPLLWTSTARTLDGYRAAIADSYTRSCRAQQRGENSQRLHDLRAGCLRRRIAVVRGVTGALVGGDHDTLRNAPRAAGTLEDLGACEDDGALLLGMDSPPPALLGELTRLRGAVDHARSLELLGAMTASAAETDDALIAARRLGHEPTLAETLFQRGRLAFLGREFAAAEDTLRESFELALATRHDALVSELWSWLIRATVQRRNDTRDADDWLRQAEAWSRRGQASPQQRASLASARDIVHQLAGDPAAAEAASRQALAWLEQALGPDHLEVAYQRFNHANSLDDLGRTDDAIEAYHHSLAVIRAKVGEEHALTSDVLYNLGVALLHQGSLDEARIHLLRGREIAEVVRGPHALELADTDVALANIARLQGDLDGADRWIAAALTIYAHHPGHPDRALALGLRGTLASERERWGEALAAHTEAREVALAAWGPGSDVVGAADSNIADLLLAQNDPAGALHRYDAAIAVLEHARGAEAIELISPLLGRGEARIALNQPCEALGDLDRGLALLEQHEMAADLDEARSVRLAADTRCKSPVMRAR